MKTILVFLIIFSIIVIIHEFGHFYFARRAGIRVREFAIGMGPKLFAHQAEDGTTYTLRILPLGGYVRLAGLGEEEAIEPGMAGGLMIDDDGTVSQINLSETFNQEELPVRFNAVDLVDDLVVDVLPTGQEEVVRYHVQSDAKIIEQDGTIVQVAPYDARYEAASPWSKFLTNVAGPMNNFILSVIVFTIIGFLLPGVPEYSPEPIIGEVISDSPAEAAGIEENDVILAVNGEDLDTWNELVAVIMDQPGETVELTIDRQGETITTDVTIEETIDVDSGESRGAIGVVKGDRYEDSLTARLTYGFRATWSVIAGVVSVIASMFKTGFNINNFGGPVAMAQMTNQVVEFGLISILNFMAWLSANLGIVNLLPIPALDGGKIVLNIIEGIRGKPVSQTTEGIITMIGVGLLFLLMILVTWNDIQRAFF